MIPVSPQELALLVQRYGSPQRFQQGGDQMMSEEVVSGAPREWQSSPDHPLAHLAYITEEEAELLKQTDLHDSGIDEEEHFGPENIPSYQGDGGGGDGGDGGTGGGDDGISEASLGELGINTSQQADDDALTSMINSLNETTLAPNESVNVTAADAEAEAEEDSPLSALMAKGEQIMQNPLTNPIMPFGIIGTLGKGLSSIITSIVGPPTGEATTSGGEASGPTDSTTTSGVPSAVPSGLSDADTSSGDPSATAWERSQTGYQPGTRYGMQGGQRFFEDPEIRPVTAAHGGLANLSKRIAGSGRYGDSQLMHINPQEAKTFRKMGATRNPKTGNLEAFDLGELLGGIAEFFTGGGGEAVTDVASTGLDAIPSGPDPSFDPGTGAGTGGDFTSNNFANIGGEGWNPTFNPGEGAGTPGDVNSDNFSQLGGEGLSNVGGGLSKGAAPPGFWKVGDFYTNGRVVIPAPKDTSFSWSKFGENINPLKNPMGAMMLGSAYSGYKGAKKTQQQQNALRQQQAINQAKIDNPNGPKYAMDRELRPFTGDMKKYGMGIQGRPGGHLWWNKSDASPVTAAKGGLSGLGPKSPNMGMRPSNLMSGPGGGQDDKIPALLSPGEYVFDADATSALGDGNPEEGARKLDKMREKIRKHKRAAPAKKIPPKAKSAESYMKGLA